MVGPEVHVSIVTTNDARNLPDCLSALADSSIPLHITVTDNGSTDGCQLFAHKQQGYNAGFGKSHNRGLACGHLSLMTPYVLVLNPDVFVEPDCIELALKCLKGNKAGAVGCKFDTRSLWPGSSASEMLKDALLLSRKGRISDQETLTHALPNGSGVMGAFMLMPRNVWQKLGGFDERFFIYYEDLDLCKRVQALGYRVMHCSLAQARHIGCGTTSRSPLRRAFWLIRSRVRFARKWHGRGFAWLLAALGFGVELPLRSVKHAVSAAAKNLAMVLRSSSRGVPDQSTLKAKDFVVPSLHEVGASRSDAGT
jgi:GT2 family glycosyltransferase